MPQKIQLQFAVISAKRRCPSLCERVWFRANHGTGAVFGPSATKSGRPHGVTSVSSPLSCRTPPLLADSHVMWPWSRDSRGRSALTLSQRLLVALQVAIPIDQFYGSHLRFMFKHRSSNEGTECNFVCSSVLSLHANDINLTWEVHVSCVIVGQKTLYTAQYENISRHNVGVWGGMVDWPEGNRPLFVKACSCCKCCKNELVRKTTYRHNLPQDTCFSTYWLNESVCYSEGPVWPPVRHVLREADAGERNDAERHGARSARLQGENYSQRTRGLIPE